MVMFYYCKFCAITVTDNPDRRQSRNSFLEVTLTAVNCRLFVTLLTYSFQFRSAFQLWF